MKGLIAKAGLTQAKLAEILETSASSVSLMVNGRAKVPPGMIGPLEKALCADSADRQELYEALGIRTVNVRSGSWSQEVPLEHQEALRDYVAIRKHPGAFLEMLMADSLAALRSAPEKEMTVAQLIPWLDMIEDIVPRYARGDAAAVRAWLDGE